MVSKLNDYPSSVHLQYSNAVIQTHPTIRLTPKHMFQSPVPWDMFFGLTGDHIEI